MAWLIPKTPTKAPLPIKNPALPGGVFLCISDMSRIALKSGLFEIDHNSPRSDSTSTFTAMRHM